MRIRLKRRSAFGVKRHGLDGNIGKIEKKEGLHVFVKGMKGLGLIVFSPKEIEMLSGKIAPKVEPVPVQVEEKKEEPKVEEKRVVEEEKDEPMKEEKKASPKKKKTVKKRAKKKKR
jgi:outer membrane biosynthesis protein TonB